MLLFHGRRSIEPALSTSNEDAHLISTKSEDLDLTIKQYGLTTSSRCVIEFTARTAGDFSEHRTYLHYPEYCDYLIGSGQLDDRVLNPDDLINRILPKLTFFFSPVTVTSLLSWETNASIETIVSPLTTEISTNPASATTTDTTATTEATMNPKHPLIKAERIIITKFQGLAPDTDAWQSLYPPHKMIFTLMKPPDLDSIDISGVADKSSVTIAAMERVSPRAPNSLKPLPASPSAAAVAATSNAATTAVGTLPTHMHIATAATARSIPTATNSSSNSISNSNSSERVLNAEASVKSPRLVPLLREEMPIEEKLEETCQNAQPNWLAREDPVKKKKKKSSLFDNSTTAVGTDASTVRSARNSFDYAVVGDDVATSSSYYYSAAAAVGDADSVSSKNAKHVYDLYYTKPLRESMTDPNLQLQLQQTGTWETAVTTTANTTTTTATVTATVTTPTSATDASAADELNSSDSIAATSPSLVLSNDSQKVTQHRRRRSSTDLPMIFENVLIDSKALLPLITTPTPTAVATNATADIAAFISSSKKHNSSGKHTKQQTTATTAEAIDYQQQQLQLLHRVPSNDSSSRSRRYTSGDVNQIARSNNISGSGKYHTDAAAFLAANALAANNESTSGRFRAAMSSSRTLNRMNNQQYAITTSNGSARLHHNAISSSSKGSSNNYNNSNSGNHNNNINHHHSSNNNNNSSKKIVSNSTSSASAAMVTADTVVRTNVHGYIIDDFNSTSITDTVVHRS